MGLITKLFWVILFLAATFLWVVLFEHGTSGFVDGISVEFENVKNLIPTGEETKTP